MYIYIIECIDNSLYTGIAKDIVKRLKEHYFQTKNCAKYTKSHKMIGLRALWFTDSKIIASKVEYQIKKLTREKKLQLINDYENDIPTFINNDFKDVNFISTKKQLEIFSQVVKNVK